MIRVGILGCANIAKRSLAPAFAAHGDFRLVAVASRTAEKATELASVHGARPCSYDELIAADDVDLVYCPLPTGLHYEWVRRALEAGKHVLCEKSLGCSYLQVRTLVELARKNGLLLMESFQFRFHAQNLFVRRLIDSGKIGRVVGVTTRFSFPAIANPNDIRYSRELGGGGLLDTGAYAIKSSTYLLGKDLSLRSAKVSTASSWAVDKDGEFVLERSDGVVSEASYSMDSEYRCGYVVRGTEGEISTTRAFTARADFDAEVVVRIGGQTERRTFRDDHFARLLDAVSAKIRAADFEEEYQEDLVQSRLLDAIARRLGYDLVARYAVFGSRGYLGAQLVSHFRSKGIVCDELDLPEADVTSPSFWKSFDPTRYSGVLFFAGLTGAAASNANRERYVAVNEGGVRNLIAKLRPLGELAPKVVFPSTRLVYKGAGRPLPEDAEKECKTVYAETKLRAEELLRDAGVPYAVIRICVPYGSIVSHGYSYGTLGFMIRQAKEGRITLFGDGGQRRTFTHVRDICEAVGRLLADDATGIFNVGGADRSLAEAAHFVASRFSAKVDFVPWPKEALALESGSTVFDSSRLDALLPAHRYAVLENMEIC